MAHVKMQGVNVPRGGCHIYGCRAAIVMIAREDATYKSIEVLMNAKVIYVLDFNYEKSLQLQEEIN